MSIQVILDSKFNAKGVQEAIAGIKGLENIAEKLSGKDLGMLKFLDVDTAKGNLPQMSANLQQAAANLDQLAIKAFSAGDATKAMEFVSRANEARSFAGEIDRLSGASEQADNSFQGLLTRFNNLGFAAFITISTIQTLIGVVRELFETAEEGAASIDKLQAFNTLLPQAGINAQDLQKRLEEAGQGAVTFDDAMQNTLRLLKAGFPEAAKNSDQLLEIATNAAILSGELDNVDTIYNKLVRGIIRGSPRLIDDADIILKLGNANETYARSLGKTVEQLTAAEKVQATYNAVIEEGARINELAEDFDSTAIKLAQVNTALAETGTAFKRTWATMVVAVAEGASILGSIVPAIAGSIAASLGASAEQVLIIQERFGSLKNVVQNVLVGLDFGLRMATGLIGETLRSFFVVISNSLQHGVLTLDFFMAKLRGDGTEANRILGEMQTMLGETLDVGNFGRIYQDTLAANTEASRKFAESIGAIAPNAEIAAQGLEGIDDAASRLNDRFKLLSDQIKAGLDPLSDENIAREGNEKRADIEKDHAEKIIDIRNDLKEKMLDIARDLKDKLADITERRNEQLLKAELDYAEKIGDIDEDLAEKLADVSGDASEKREKLEKDRHKKIQKAEKDHQDEINKILRRYEMDRLSALIDRDARALFEAQLKRDEDLANATKSRDEERQEANADFQEKMEEINKQEQERRNEAIKEAEKRRKDAKEALEKQRKDAIDQYNKARAEAKKAADEQRSDARKAYNDARQDAIESYRDRLDDLRKWYQDQFRAQQEARIRERLQELQAMAEREELTAAHLDNLSQMWADYRNFVSDVSGQGNNYSAPTFNAGNLPTGSGLPDIGGDSPFSNPYGYIPNNAGLPAGMGFSAVSPTNGESPGSTVNVNITTDDSTLDEILKGYSYEAVMEVIR